MTRIPNAPDGRPLHDGLAAKCDALDRAAPDASIDRDLMKRVATVRSLVHGRIVFTMSFGIEDQAIAHAIFRQALEIVAPSNHRASIASGDLLAL